MIKLYLKTALLSIIGFLLTNTTAVPMDRFIQDDHGCVMVMYLMHRCNYILKSIIYDRTIVLSIIW